MTDSNPPANVDPNAAEHGCQLPTPNVEQSGLKVSSGNGHALQSRNGELASSEISLPLGLPEFEEAEPREETAPEPEKKRHVVIRGIKHVSVSLLNTSDDLSWRHIDPNRPANAVYHRHFIGSTVDAWKTLAKPNPIHEELAYIDERELPFRKIVCQLPNCSDEIVDANRDILESCLFLSYFFVLWSVYKVAFSFFWLVSIGVTMGATLTFIMWLAFASFAGMIWLFYGYHCWIIKRDRFATLSMFVKQLLSLEVAAWAPYSSLQGVPKALYSSARELAHRCWRGLTLPYRYIASKIGQ